MYIRNKLICFKISISLKAFHLFLSLMEEENAEYLLFLRSSKARFPSTASFTVNGFVSSQCCELESLATFCQDSHGKPFLSYSVPPLVCQVRAGVTGALHAGFPVQHPGSCSQLLIILRLPHCCCHSLFQGGNVS